MNDLMMTINNQLRSDVMGRAAATQAAAIVPAMNPKEAFFNSPGSTRLYEKFDAVASLYIEAKRKDTRPTTFRSYSSFLPTSSETGSAASIRNSKWSASPVRLQLDRLGGYGEEEPWCTDV